MITNRVLCRVNGKQKFFDSNWTIGIIHNSGGLVQEL
jgi:hypothetical protein